MISQVIENLDIFKFFDSMDTDDIYEAARDNCELACQFIIQHHGCEGMMVVNGYYEGQEHWWITYDGYIIDMTIVQFGVRKLLNVTPVDDPSYEPNISYTIEEYQLNSGEESHGTHRIMRGPQDWT